MLFNSFIFVGLVFITFFLYYLPILSRFQIHVLILSSLIFYAYNQPFLVLLLLFSGAINIVTSYYVFWGNSRKKKIWAVSGVVINLLVLAFFKYSPLFAKTLFSPVSCISQFLLTVPLPIGISFFTFKGITLVLDAYRGSTRDTNNSLVSKSLVKHSWDSFFFVSFFTGLLAGPIDKAHHFIPQIKEKHFGDIDWNDCFKKLVVGYFLKMVIADNLKDFTFWIAFPYFQAYSTLTLLIMLFGYSCQIFADFAGYSLIAIGVSKLFGYALIDNFNFPYISISFREFWKRWHISLSSFLMEYLYIPLGGNRKGKVRTYINLMITMVLGGLWHGAAWSYAVWGTLHGLALAIERFLTDNFTIRTNEFINLLRGTMVFLFVTFAWLFFKLPNFSHVIEYFKTLYSNSGIVVFPIIVYILIYSLPVILYHVAFLVRQNDIYRYIKKLEYLVYGFMIFMIITNSGSSAAFIYFQF